MAGVAGLAAALQLAGGNEPDPVDKQNPSMAKRAYAQALEDFNQDEDTSRAPPDLRVLPSTGQARTRQLQEICATWLS